MSKKFNILLAVLLLGALFVRVYRTEAILQFFYDPGRDAIQIWELIHKGDIFLIGPTTGIAGIFRGPAFYYLITPLYWLGNGNPVWPANFLALTTVIAIALGYYLLTKFQDKTAGLFFVIFSGFSFHLMRSARWLSNPTPMFLLSMLLILAFYLIMQGKKWAWVLLSFVFGLSLFHFGSSGEFFYSFAISFFTIWLASQGRRYSKSLPDKRNFIFSVLAFLFTISPLVIFDLKNDQLLSNNIKTFLFEKESFKADLFTVFKQRVDFYDGVFWGKIFPSAGKYSSYLKFTSFVLFVYYFKDLFKNKYFKLLILILGTVMTGLLFFQGNEGNIYDYYMTGYYLIFILLLSLFLRQVWTTFVGKVFVLVFIFVFLAQNLPIIKNNITDQVDGPTTISYKAQKQAMDWVYENAKGEKFNADVYVPPVIPYAYDYLFLYYENNLDKAGKVEVLVPLLYTIYEQDPPHPERLEAWLARQKGIGIVEEEKSFAGITVQRRKRIL